MRMRSALRRAEPVLSARGVSACRGPTVPAGSALPGSPPRCAPLIDAAPFSDGAQASGRRRQRRRIAGRRWREGVDRRLVNEQPEHAECADCLGQAGERYWLPHIGVGAAEVALEDVLFLPGGGEDDNGDEPGPLVGPDAAEYFEPVDLGELQIEQDESGTRRVGPVAREKARNGLGAIAGHGDFDQDVALLAGQGEVEGRTVVNRTLGPGAATVALHDALHAGEANARAGEIALRMQPLEWLEQLVRVGGVEAGAVVAHVAADTGALDRDRPELDQRFTPAGGEFPGIAQQVLQYGADKRAVRPGPDWVLDDEADAAARSLALEFLGNAGGLGAEIDGLGVKLGPRDARKIQ